MASSLVNDIRGNRIVVGLVPALYEKVEVTYPDANTEVYSFSYQGTVIGVVTLIYNGSDDLISAERTA